MYIDNNFNRSHVKLFIDSDIARDYIHRFNVCSTLVFRETEKRMCFNFLGILFYLDLYQGD